MKKISLLGLLLGFNIGVGGWCYDVSAAVV